VAGLLHAKEGIAATIAGRNRQWELTGMVKFACHQGDTVGNALRGVPLGPERHGGRSLQDFGRRKCYPGLNHANL
jgi:hypothetical protein